MRGDSDREILEVKAEVSLEFPKGSGLTRVGAPAQLSLA